MSASAIGMRIVGLQQIVEKLQRGSRGPSAYSRGLERAAIRVEGRAKELVYAGRPKHLIGDRGHLRQSITHRLTGPTTVVVGSNLVYAPVHEFGATIRPVRAKRLAWRDKAHQWHFAMQVHIPPRPYLKPALQDERANVRMEILRALQEVLRG